MFSLIEQAGCSIEQSVRTLVFALSYMKTCGDYVSLRFLLVATETVAITVHQLILFGIYFFMYSVKHSQVGSYLFRLNAYFRNINFLKFFII